MLRLTRTSCLKTGAAQKQPIQVEIVLVHTCMNVSAALVSELYSQDWLRDCVSLQLHEQSRGSCQLDTDLLAGLLKPVHTVAEKCDCRQVRRLSPLSRRFLRQCGQGFSDTANKSATSRCNGIWETTRHNIHNGLLPALTCYLRACSGLVVYVAD